MAVDRRKKDVVWDVVDLSGAWYTGNYAGAQLATLMDIRDELQRLNALLYCRNFTGIPATLRTINRKLRPRKPRRRA